MRAAASLFALCLLLVTPATAATWTEVRTPNFLLIGDARAGDMRRVAVRFERFHAVMQRVLSRQAVSSAVPTVVLVFANERAFQPYMPVHQGKRIDVGGLFWGGRDLNYVALNAEHGEYSYPTIFHELTHLITANVLRRPPLWFVEGIAEYYSTFEIRSPTEVFLGRPIAEHTRLLQDQFIPLRDLFAANETTRLTDERNRRTIFYAESWALVHYLRGNPETRPRFDEFLRQVDLGTPHEEALQRAFGLDVATLEKALRNYVRQFRVPGERWTLGSPVTESSITTAVVPEPVALTHLGRILLRDGRHAEAEARLTAAIAADARLAMAHASLASLRLRQDRAADAWKQVAAAPPGRDFLDHYFLAVAADHYLDVVGEDTDQGEEALPVLRQHAAAAVAARPDVAEAWRMVARVALAEDELTEASEAITKALALAPAYEPYRFVLANVFGQQREFAKARNLLGELMAQGRTSEVRTAARRFMASLVAYERQFAPAEPPGDTRQEPDPRPAGDSRLVPTFRNVQPGETRVLGTLTRIACEGGGVTLVVESEGRTLRLTVPSFEAIDFITYRDDLAGEVRCAARTPADPVYVTWPGERGDGESLRVPKVTVEFLPRDFTPKPGGPAPAS